MAAKSNWRAESARGQRFVSCCRFAKDRRVCWRPVRMLKPSLLIVDDEKPTRDGLRAALQDRYDVYVAEDAASAAELLERDHFDALLTDFRLPNDDGMKLIARAKSLSKPPVCILMTAYGSEELAVQAM